MADSRDATVRKPTRSRRLALPVLLCVFFVFVLRMAAPLWIGVLLGTLSAFSLQGIYRRLAERMGGHHTLSALLATTLAGAAFVVPCVGIFYVLTGELGSLIALLQNGLNSESLARYIAKAPAGLVERLGLHRDTLVPHVDQWLEHATGYASAAAAFVLQTVSSSLLALLIGLMTCYAVLRHWSTLTMRLERVLPLEARHTRALLLEFARVGRGTLMGTLETAAIQALLATVGYVVTRVPHALTWGLLTAAASLVPVVSTALAWVPASIYLFATGHPVLGAIGLGWGILVVSGVGEYVIRPRLVGAQNGGGSSLLTLISVIGGVQMFGVVGLVAGPVVMSLFLAVLRLYERERANRSSTVPHEIAP